MDEYIKREAAIAAAFTANAIGNSAYRDIYDTVNRLRLIPAADVVPVRHGRWCYNKGDNIPYCSECLMPQDTECNYCPNCGARCDL